MNLAVIIADAGYVVTLAQMAIQTAQDAAPFIAPLPHFDDYATSGLRGAARRIPADLTRGGAILEGREELRRLFRMSSHAQPAIAIAARARWTLRAFAGGYCRRIDADQPEDNAYKVLMEGLESFAAMLRGVGLRELDSERNYDYTSS